MDGSPSPLSPPSYPLDVCLGPSAELDNELLFTVVTACEKVPLGVITCVSRESCVLWCTVGRSMEKSGGDVRSVMAGLR